MKLGFLYGGQGSQVVSMGLDFYENLAEAKAIYDSMPSSKKITELSFYGDEETLKETENTQIAMVAFQCMVTKLLKEKGICPDVYCGLSIGEFSALYGSGVLSMKDAIKISAFRGRIMAEDMKNIDSAMYAIIGSSEEEINTILEKINTREEFCQISNINSPNQIVISGNIDAVEKLKSNLKDLGRKAIKLKVSGAFHTDYMENASKKLEKYFEDIKFNKDNKDLYLNFTGKKHTTENLKEVMVEQVKSTVRLDSCIREMINDGVSTFIEIGFNKVLKKIIEKSGYQVKVYSVSSYESYKELLEEVNGK